MLRWRDCLRVNVQSGTRGRVPQQLLHDLELGPNASQQCRVCVAKGTSSTEVQDHIPRRRCKMPIARSMEIGLWLVMVADQHW